MRDARVLIIDDEKNIRYTFERFLSMEGYAVQTAKDYHEARSKIRSEDFDLVFADIVLEGRSGLELLPLIAEKDPGCPVVVITGHPDIETASESVRLRAFDYIHKPIKREVLLRVAGAALRHRRLSDEKEQYRLNLEAIFRSVREAIITVDKNLTVIEVNEAAGNICGLSRDAIGRGLAPLLEKCSGKCLEALRKTVREKRAVEISRFECKSSARPAHMISLFTSPLLDHQGVTSGAVMVVYDETRLAGLEHDLDERHHFHNIVGKSEKMQRIYSLIESLSGVQTTVLITGESGTGKDLTAEALHYGGSRSSKPMVKVNCSALSENLLESELFGHAKGAFTGAIKDVAGRFQRADGGTIFLDEIGDISPRMQLRLLRVLQDGEFERVGDPTPIKVNTRVIAATNRNLREKVSAGEFREDLLYRLKVVEISLPPLRERREDIPLLTDYFIRRFNKEFTRAIHALSPEVRRIFMKYHWPGNVRELEHTLEHAFILCRGNTITPDDLPPDLIGASLHKARAGEGDRDRDLRAVLDALEKAGWNKAKAARLLGIDRKTIYRKIKRYQIKCKTNM
ncbi:MAG TPA: sigma 54-interacting transcriptional regulator [Dissulfurispiraceae bacterium]